GSNAHGELGDGTTDNRARPVEVVSLTAPPTSVASPLAVQTTSVDNTQTLPYRVVVTGPSQAVAGSDITYTLHYERVPVTNSPGADIVFVYSMSASLERIDTTAGVQPLDHGEQGAGAERLSLMGNSGTVQFVVRPRQDFTGTLNVGLAVPGTQAQVPAGSVRSIPTQISP